MHTLILIKNNIPEFTEYDSVVKLIIRVERNLADLSTKELTEFLMQEQDLFSEGGRQFMYFSGDKEAARQFYISCQG